VDDSSDCDDLSASIHPDAEEVCDGADNDCDGSTDEADATDVYTWYYDGDGDGFGLDSDTVTACDPPRDHVAHGGDCDDTDPSYNPGALEADCADPADYNCDGSVGYADADGDGFAACADCDDADANTNEDAAEICDGIDNDCDGDIDSGDGNVQGASTWYADADGDGYGGSQFQAEACEAPPGYVNNTDDCDDLDAASHPGASEVCDDADNDCDGDIDEGVGSTWYADTDADGYGDATSTTDACTPPLGYTTNGDDCDDNAAAISPAAVEICDSVDNDCDGVIDDDAINAATWYIDSDGDGYGTLSVTTISCDQPSGFAGNAADCEDGDASVNPGANETCDGVDNDCDGSTDGPDSVNIATWYEDVDGDGYGTLLSSVVGCNQPSGYAPNASDCEDGDPTVNPSATETCDSIDNDCDGTVDESEAIDAGTWYTDTDSDGYGSPTGAVTTCEQPFGTVLDATDCDDSSAAVNPAASEVCDGVDNDCDGTADENDATDASTWYADTDSDGYGDRSSTIVACSQPSGSVSDATDCDDTNSDQYLCTSCQNLFAGGFSTGDGNYFIDVDGISGSEASFGVYCDMTSHGGGWTLVLRAGLGRDLTSPDLTGNVGPAPNGASNPGGNVLEKLSDSLINQIKTASGNDIAYWVTTPGSGTGLYGAENFHRGDCTFALHQTSSEVKNTNCHYSTINYSLTPTWESGGHWWDNGSSYRWAFGYANEGDHGTGPTCHQDGTGLGPHAGVYAPFHRGWCGTAAWGLVFVR
jgi:hypothetical protein